MRRLGRFFFAHGFVNSVLGVGDGRFICGRIAPPFAFIVDEERGSPDEEERSEVFKSATGVVVKGENRVIDRVARRVFAGENFSLDDGVEFLVAGLIGASEGVLIGPEDAIGAGRFENAGTIHLDERVAFGILRDCLRLFFRGESDGKDSREAREGGGGRGARFVDGRKLLNVDRDAEIDLFIGKSDLGATFRRGDRLDEGGNLILVDAFERNRLEPEGFACVVESDPQFEATVEFVRLFLIEEGG